MSKKQIGIVGWRGMVGSVLLERMREEDDLSHFDPLFLSTSQAGGKGPKINASETILGDAYDLETLQGLDIIISCQGSDYTGKVHPELRAKGWNGFWIDSASKLRNEPSSVLLLDPVNRDVIDKAIAEGKKDLIGANCTVGTMLMGLAGLFKAGLVESANPSTYQAVSGAGSKHVIELLKQFDSVGDKLHDDLANPAKSILEIDKKASEHLRSGNLPSSEFGYPIAGNILPWIDSEMDNGQSREEYKAQIETNAILGFKPDEIIVDGTCVRVGSLRSHAQAVMLKLKDDRPVEELEEIISSAHEWIRFVPNTKDDTLRNLTPVSISGSLEIAVGRLRKLNNGPGFINIFVVGDQLLWGAAEPLRRALGIVKSL
ncbi:MAG TPA: aspartate-semialdehyde dehydrogenase [Candidatus Saccharimonadales bacterium]|nr:aspartate-semialdehyde dehydrogenase [Candidatus Saccharimonadales bacterium]